MKVLRSTRFKLCPKQTRARDLSNAAGAARWIDNWGVAEWQARYKRGETVSCETLAAEIPQLKKDPKTTWLTEVLSQGLQQARITLGRAYQYLLDKATTAIVRRSPTIAHEDLPIRNMTASARGPGENPRTNVRQKAGLNRAILAPGVQRVRDLGIPLLQVGEEVNTSIAYVSRGQVPGGDGTTVSGMGFPASVLFRATHE